MLQAKRLYAHRVVAAGNKFDNHKFSYCGGKVQVDSRIDYTNLRVVCATEKCSGSMFRVAAHPTLAGNFVVGTKNGTEEKYLFTFQEVIKKQFGNELMIGLWHYLDQTESSLNMELVTKQIKGRDGKVEACCHGYSPLTDHVIIHGGTKKNQDPLNPLDLYQMRNTIARDWGKEVIRGMWFPHATYFITKNGYSDLLGLEKAFIEVNNKVLCPKIRKVAPCSLDDAVAGPVLEEGVVHNYHYWSTGFRAEACRRGIPSCRVFDHFTWSVDNGDNLEGWVVHYISKEMMEPGGGYELLCLCLDQDKPMFYEARIPAMEEISTGFRWSSGAEETGVLMGFVPLEESSNRKLSIDDMLERYAAGSVLTNFLWGLVDFVESEEGVICGMTKNSFFIQLDTLKEVPDTVIMTVTMKGEMQWYLYEEYYRKILHNTQVVKFCRGFSMLLTSNEEEAMDVMGCGGGGKMQENRDKWKLVNYTLNTMALRPFYDKLECVVGVALDAVSKKKASLISWEERFSQLFDLGFLTRWGVIYSTSRFEALKYMYLVGAYCSSRAKNPDETYLDMVNNMMKYLETPNSRRAICVDWLTLYGDVRGLAVTPTKTACSMIEALANGDGDAFMEMAVLALEDPSNALLFAFVKDIELGLGILNRVVDKSLGGGFMYTHLLNNQKINNIKAKFAPLLLLTCKYNVNFIYKNSKPIQTLKIVLVAGTVGMGKTTYLREVAKIINESYDFRVANDLSSSSSMRCVAMGADTFGGSTGKERYSALFSEIAACMESDPDINMLLLDRCCASDFKSLRMLLRGAFPSKLLDIHLMIPSHGITVVQGNEKDWFFPFSLEQIAVNSCSALTRKHNDGLMPAANAVEGAKGFDVAIKHIVAARTAWDIENTAREEFRSLSGNFNVSYFKYVSGEVAVPRSIMVAVALGMGLQLSKETKQNIEKTSVQRGGLISDGVILRTLALCLRDSYGHSVEALEILLSDLSAVESADDSNIILDKVWPDWLNKVVKEDAARFLSEARLPTNVTVAEMTNALLNRATASAPASDKNLVERLHIPFIPQYFGIQVTAPVKEFLCGNFMEACGGEAGSINLYCKRGDIHVTTVVPTMLSEEAAAYGGILRIHINFALKFEPFKFRVDTVVAGATTNAALVTVTSDNYHTIGGSATHLTLMCSGPNKDSIKEERIQHKVNCCEWALEVQGNYMGKLRAPTLFGIY